KELQSDKASQGSVFRLVDDTHTSAAQFFDDAVVRDGLPDHWEYAWLSGRFILRTQPPRVNERPGIAIEAGKIQPSQEAHSWTDTRELRQHAELLVTCQGTARGSHAHKPPGCAIGLYERYS